MKRTKVTMVYVGQMMKFTEVKVATGDTIRPSIVSGSTLSVCKQETPERGSRYSAYLSPCNTESGLALN